MARNAKTDAEALDETKTDAEAVDDTKSDAEPVNDEWAPVKIKLFKDNDKYKEDVFVAVNGRSFQIQRGVEVEVPRCIKEVLDHQMTQEQTVSESVAKAMQ